MIHSKEYPPNWEQINKIFPKAKEQQTIFCYGETLHNPFKAEITRDLEIHEAVHSKQQGKDPQKWWNKYCEDPEFRIEQEIQAYGTQLYYLKTTKVKKQDDNGKDVMVYLPSRVVEWYIEQVAKTLSGPLYGECIDFNKVKTRLRHFIREINE